MFYRAAGLEISASVVELFTKSEDPYEGTSPVMFLYRTYLLYMYRMTHH